MKQFFSLVFLGILSTSFTFFTGIDDVISEIKTGNAAQVAKYFDLTVEISTPAKTNSYSKSQAEMVLRDFFAMNSVKGFDVIHKGEKGGSQFCIGTLVTKTGNFRTTVFMKQKGTNLVLQEIRFENS